MKHLWMLVVFVAACDDPSQRLQPSWRSSQVPSGPVSVVWTTPVDGGVVGAHADTCFWVATVGSMYCLDPASGTIRWQNPFAGVVTGPVALGDGAAVATKTGEVVGLANDGNERWRFVQDASMTQLVADVHGVVAATSRGKVIALDFDGDLRWEFQLGAPPAPMAADERGVVLAGAHGHVVALTPDGEVLWTRALSGPVTRGPVLAGDDVVVTTADSMQILLRDTGELVRTPEFVATRGTPAAQQGKAWIPSEALTAIFDGQVAWSRDLEVGWGGLVGSGDALVVATQKDVYALDAETGKTRWRHKFEVPIWQPPTVHDGVYVSVGASIVRLGDQPAATKPE